MFVTVIFTNVLNKMTSEEGYTIVNEAEEIPMSKFVSLPPRRLLGMFHVSTKYAVYFYR